MHTHIHRHTHTLAVLPLGPRVVPLSGARVVVDKVNSAIVLTLLCGTEQTAKNQRKYFCESSDVFFAVYRDGVGKC